MAELRADAGVGLALRWAFIDDVAPETPVAFFEISPENYMKRGGLFPQALSSVCEHHRVTTHGLSMNLGSTDPLDRAYLLQLRAFLDELGVLAHSDHLCWTGSGGNTLHDLLPLPTDEATVVHVADRIRRVQDALRRPLLIENISYYLLPRQRMPEEEFVARVLERADCRLLLDVNNVWVNAQNHGFDPYAYLRAMPLQRVERIHVAGGERLAKFDGLVIDTHGADVGDPVVEMMAWVLERTGPVPVVYERDHAIPPLPELLRQVADLQRAYDHAVSRPARSPERAPIPEVSLAREGDPLGDLQLGLSRAVLDVDPPHARLIDRLRARRLDDGAIEVLGSLRTERIAVYRDLVRNALRRTINDALPRTAARRTEPAFARDIADWLDASGPRSRYLRDVPLEFGAWIGAAWLEDPTVPGYLPDLLEHELVDWQVRAVPSPNPPSIVSDPWSVDDCLRFDGSIRLACYSWRIHELPDDPASDVAPQPGVTRLLAYRDREHEVRWLELTPLAYEVLSRLIAGDRLGESVLAGAAESGESLDDAVLSRIGALLFDLAERGVLLGAATDGAERRRHSAAS